MKRRSGWVIDANVANKWYLRDEDLLAQADAIRHAFGDQSADVVCPHVARHEVANTMAVAYRGERISRDRAIASFSDFLASGISNDGDADWLIHAAIAIAMELPVFINDGVYIALADRLGIQCVTADRKLYDAVSDRYPFVTWLGDIPIP
jgi:predicted nucleic acid-binding protein